MGRFHLTMMLIVAAFVPLGSLAQDATPVPRFNRPTQLDLAAMTLTPTDVASIGLTGFGLAGQSSLRDAEAESVLQTGGRSRESEEILAAYRANGFRFRYVGSLLKPRLPLERLPSGFFAAEQRLSTSIAEYATSAGAAASFGLNEGLLDERPGIDLSNSAIGNESELSRSTGREAGTHTRFQRLELTFRVDNLIAEVSIIDFDDIEPEVATVERLAALLLEKINRARQEPGPGLSSSVLRIAPLAPWVEAGRLRDFYIRINGRRDITFAQMVEEISKTGSVAELSPSTTTEAALIPRDTYMYWTPVGQGVAANLPLYVSWIDRYDSVASAKDALRASRAADLGPGYVNVRNFTRADEQMGEEWRAFGYVYDGEGQDPARGYVMISRVGDTIVRVQADAPDGVNRYGVVALTRLQLACLQNAGACVPVNADWVTSALVPVGTLAASPQPTD